MAQPDPDRLSQLEADISAVASALETLDRIIAESEDGAVTAREIATVVSAERFPLDSDRPGGSGGPEVGSVRGEVAGADEVTESTESPEARESPEVTPAPHI